MKRVLLCALLLGGSTPVLATGPGPGEIRLWHAAAGMQAAQLENLAARFNASQSAWRVAASIAGAGRAPHLMQSDEAPTAAPFAGKHAVRPLWRVMARAKLPLGVGSDSTRAYSDSRGRLVALPLSLSTPVLYFNRDAFKRARIAPAVPTSWYEMPKTIGALIDAGQPCGLTAAGPAWVLLESMSAWHGEPFATVRAGSDGQGARLAFNGQLLVRWVAMLASWQKAGYFTYAGRGDEAEARFAAGECAMLASSSASYAQLAARAAFDIGVAPLPYYDDFLAAPQNTLARSSALWVIDGRPARDYAGVAAFLAFVQSQRAADPAQRIALRQLENAPAGNSRGVRAGGLPGMREIIDEELESVWEGTKTPLDALNAAVERGNVRLTQLRR